jgi:hypothetical protein
LIVLYGSVAYFQARKGQDTESRLEKKKIYRAIFLNRFETRFWLFHLTVICRPEKKRKKNGK